MLQRGKRHPPLCKNQPPHGGAIYWARLLFYRLKKSILKIQEVEELKSSRLKMEAFNNYLKIAKALKQYEKTKFDQWISEVSPIIENTMKMNILKVFCKQTMKGKLPT